MGMFIGTPSSIVTDGLKGCFDAGNTASYPGTGTTWTDVSGNGNHGTILQSSESTYTTANGGYFAATNALMWCPFVHTAGQDLSVCYWIMHKQAASGIIFGSYNDSNSELKPLSEQGGDGYAYNNNSNIDHAVTQNVWYYYTFAETNGGNTKIFRNGVQIADSGTTASASVTKIKFSAHGSFASNSSNVDANWAMIQLYPSKALTLVEHTQNYNAHKHRFGL